MIPVAVVILWQPILMDSSDVNVNIFTAMIGTIVFGIGVDDSIHVMHRIQEEGETPTGIANSIEETGQTIFETTITTVSGIAAGFLVTFPGLENFFMIMCLLIIFAFITSTFLLPAVFTLEAAPVPAYALTTVKSLLETLVISINSFSTTITSLVTI